MRRVVVTGLGMVTPLGCGVEATWQRLLAGESGAAPDRDLRGRPTCRPRSPARSRAATAPTAPTIPTSGWSRRSSARSTISSSMRCARRARRSTMPAGSRRAHEDQIATGVMIGSGIGGIEGIAETAITLKEKGPRRVSPFFIPGRLINSRPATCRSSSASRARTTRWSPPARPARMRSAMPARLIALGDADVMVAGGAESPVNRLSMAGFAACRALSTGFNDTPTARLAPLRQATATASSWARAPASSCWRNTSTPRRAARRSMPS